MDLNKAAQWWKNFVGSMNAKGVPVPMVRFRGEGNPALTLVFVSAGLIVVGIVGKWSGRLGGIDMASAMQFFFASCTLFFGHSFIHKDSKGDVDTFAASPPDKGP